MRTVVRRAAAGAGVALVLLLLLARPASAHVELIGTAPIDGAVVDRPVTEVQLVFSALVKQQFSTVIVADAAGQSYSDGTSRVLDSTLTQPVRQLPPGTFTVTWRTVAADGHPLQGQFGFQVAGGAGPAAQPGHDDSSQAVVATSEPVAQDPSVWAWLTWTGAAVLVTAAAILTWPWLRTATGERTLSTWGTAATRWVGAARQRVARTRKRGASTPRGQ